MQVDGNLVAIQMIRANSFAIIIANSKMFQNPFELF